MADYWQNRAACAGMDPGIFFSSKRACEAAAVCAQCPVVAQCRAFSEDDSAGTWSGQFRGTGKTAGPSLTRDYLQECGTTAGYKRHRRRGDPACQRCLAAHRAYQRAHQRAREGVGA